MVKTLSNESLNIIEKPSKECGYTFFNHLIDCQFLLSEEGGIRWQSQK